MSTYNARSPIQIFQWQRTSLHSFIAVNSRPSKGNVFLISNFSLGILRRDFSFISKEQRSVFVVFKWKCFPSFSHILLLLLLLLLLSPPPISVLQLLLTLFQEPRAHSSVNNSSLLHFTLRDINNTHIPAVRGCKMQFNVTLLCTLNHMFSPFWLASVSHIPHACYVTQESHFP